jgi:hypothetical protein
MLTKETFLESNLLPKCTKSHRFKKIRGRHPVPLLAAAPTRPTVERAGGGVGEGEARVKGSDGSERAYGGGEGDGKREGARMHHDSKGGWTPLLIACYINLCMLLCSLISSWHVQVKANLPNMNMH